MSCYNSGCTDNNPCNQCSSCETPNPCYKDCGCPNPTTWQCVTHPGIHQAIGVTDSMTGPEVLASIATTVDNLVVGIPPSGNDKFVKITATDTSADYLNNKLIVLAPLVKTVLAAGSNEKIRLSLSAQGLISADSGNLVQAGTDGKLRVLSANDPADIQVSAGSGVTVTGSGPASDPFVVSINPSISVARPCFDGVWRNMTVPVLSHAQVTHTGGTPQFRYRYDGTLEFRGSATYTVAFGAYTTANRKFTVTVASVPTTCVTAGEQTGTSDLKGINYIDPSGAGDQITQMYGYIIRKNAQNFIIEFQSSFIATTTKTIVVNFEGVVVYPNI